MLAPTGSWLQQPCELDWQRRKVWDMRESRHELFMAVRVCRCL